MRKNIHSVTTQIRAIETVSNNIKIFTLTDPDDWHYHSSTQALT